MQENTLFNATIRENLLYGKEDAGNVPGTSPGHLSIRIVLSGLCPRDVPGTWVMLSELLQADKCTDYFCGTVVSDIF